MKKNIIITVCIFLLVVLLCIAVILPWNKNTESEIKDYVEHNNCIARIYYSDMKAMDAGTEYNILIYETANNSGHIYVKTSDEITIAGPGELNYTEMNIIDSENNLTKLINEAKNYKYYAAFYFDGNEYVEIENENIQTELVKFLFE